MEIRPWNHLPTALLFLSACAPGQEPELAQPEPASPDIVLVVVDALRADRLGTYGHAQDTSPALDSLAEQGAVFLRAYSHSSWTLPGVASLLTGRLPAEHGAVRDPAAERSFGKLDAGLPTLAALLSLQGYRTAAFVNNVFLAPEFGVDRGFDQYDYVGTVGVGERSASQTVEAALAWLQQSPEPSFVMLHFMEPHTPYLPSEQPWWDAARAPDAPLPVPYGLAAELEDLLGRSFVPNERELAFIHQLYDAEIRETDHAFGELVTGLQAQQRWDGTVLAYTADHGEEFWDHGGFGHGNYMYGEVLRVPLVLRGPGIAPQRLTGSAQHADLFRTLAAFGGVELPPQQRGIDLRPHLATQGPELPADRDVLSGDCLYGKPRVAITVDDRRVIANLESKRVNLFQLDPHGQGDQIVTDPALLESVAQLLLQRLVQGRGGLEPGRAGGVAVALEDAEIEQLRALGYLGTAH